jgi:DNA-binding SARP family transcriptional activator/tetratricopeptide (TPR) repeat protein
MFETRTRLLDLIEAAGDAHVVVAAGGGMGKTVLATQLLERWPSWTMATTRPLPNDLPDASVLVVDNAHELGSADIGALIDLADSTRLILLGRVLPQLLPSALGPAFAVDASQLLFDSDELEAMTGDANTAASVKLLTAGWPMAVGRLLTEVGGRGADLDPGLAARKTTVVDSVLSPYLNALDQSARIDLGRLAFPASVDRELIEKLGSSERCRQFQIAGVPIMTPAPDRYKIPRPIRQALRRLIKVSTEDLEPLVAAMVEREDFVAALDTCAQAGWSDRAAAVLADLTPDQVYSTDGRRIANLLSILGSELHTRPATLLTMARISITIGESKEGRAALERALDLMDESDSGHELPLYHEVLSELAFMEYQAGNFSRAAKLRDRCAELIPVDDSSAARARLLETTAGLLAQEKRKAALVEAKGMFADAINIWNRLGHLTRAGASLRFLVWYVLFELGHHREALDLLDRALASGGVTTVETALNHVGRAACLGPLGRHDEAEAALADGQALIAALDVDWLKARAHWTRAVNRSFLGDGDTVQAEIDQATAALGPQSEGPNGARFHSEAAIALARCGRQGPAQARLARARRARGGDPGDVALAESTLAACFGDEQTALRLLARLGDEIPVTPAAEWTVVALTAVAHQRAGNNDLANLHLKQAEELAAETGNLDLLRTTEGRFLANLLDPGLDPEPSADAEAVLETAAIDVRLFGPFKVDIDGERADVSRGHCSTVVKLLVLNDGAVHNEVAIDVLWPKATVAVGRRRLRNILRRLRAVDPRLVERHGEVLRVGPSVDADYWRSKRALDAALQPASANLDAYSDAFIQLFEPELLAEDRYADWAEQQRVTLNQQRLRVLDHLTETALADDDVDRAVAMLEQALALAPLDYFRAERAASLLRDRGRDQASKALLERARLHQP